MIKNRMTVTIQVINKSLSLDKPNKMSSLLMIGKANTKLSVAKAIGKKNTINTWL